MDTENFDSQFKKPMRLLVGLNHIIDFGKHKWKTIAWLIENDPGYIGWVDRNITEFVIKPDVVALARDKAKAHYEYFDDQDESGYEYFPDQEF